MTTDQTESRLRAAFFMPRTAAATPSAERRTGLRPAFSLCAAKDPRKPRFARVPQGGETCRFCLMLASRGAVYLTEHKAGAVSHYHANCDCKVVPDFGDGIEGYDPSVYYDKYRAMLEGHELEEHYDLLERYGRTTKRLYKTAAYDYKKALGVKGKSGGNARRRETERAAISLKASSVRIRYEGGFGGATVDARKAYAASDASPSELFGLRMGVHAETQGDFSKLNKSKQAVLYAGMEHACKTLGYPPGKTRLVSAQSLKSSYAEARRRSDGVTVHVDPSKLAKLSEDEIEQIVFHEIAHGKEYEGLPDAQFDREAKRLARFQAGEIAKLSASTASKRLEKCLIDAGVSAVYIPFRGKINLSGNDKAQVEQLPQYAWTGADRGTQDSELIAESLRFVANDGFGKNRVADIIATEFGGNR